MNGFDNLASATMGLRIRGKRFGLSGCCRRGAKSPDFNRTVLNKCSQRRATKFGRVHMSFCNLRNIRCGIHCGMYHEVDSLHGMLVVRVG